MIKNAVIVGYDTPKEKYNTETERRASPKYVMRSHAMAEILRNPLRWYRGYESPQTGAKEYGDVLDCLYLTPYQWHQNFCVTPVSYTNKDGKTVKWRADMRVPEVAAWYEAHEGKTVVGQDTLGMAQAAIKRLDEDPLLLKLKVCSRKQVMIVAEWHDKETGLVVPLKCLIDAVPNKDDPIFGNAIFDLKSTKNASPRSFSRDAQKFFYGLQGQFYVDMYNAATGKDEQRSDFGHIVQESFPPYEYRTPPPLMTQRFLNFGRAQYSAALTIYCRGMATGKWPSYDPQDGNWPRTDCDDWYLDAGTVYQPIGSELPEDEEPAPSVDLMP